MNARFLRIFAVLILVATIAFWALSGANSHSTKTPVVPEKTDADAYIEARAQFHPGIEFLAGNALLAIVIFTASFFVPKKSAD